MNTPVKKKELVVEDLLNKAGDKLCILLLKEVDGERRLPVMVGLLEAQAIAKYRHRVATPRPMIHDLFLSLALSFSIRLKEVDIYKVQAGVFYAYLVCEQYGQEVLVDARTSDAVALALRMGCPLFVDEGLLSRQCAKAAGEGIYSVPAAVMDSGTLKQALDIAVEKEDYELAAHLRDLLRQREEDSQS